MPDKNKVDWNIPLDFELPQPEQPPAAPQAAPRPAARETLKQQAPHILERIDRDWCSLELHRYFEDVLFSDPNAMKGLAPEVISALGETHRQHRRVLIVNGLLHKDVWDQQIGDTLAGKKR